MEYVRLITNGQLAWMGAGTMNAKASQPMRHGPHRDFEFNLRELAGSVGDFGTLAPLALGLIVICKMDPVALFCMIGLTNMVTGIVYRLPMPVEPKKVVAATAISQAWEASVVSATGMGLGLIWLALSLAGLARRLADLTPKSVIRGIQLALGINLCLEAVRLARPEPHLALIALALLLLLRQSRVAPGSLVVVGLGIVLMAWRGDLSGLRVRFDLPTLHLPAPRDIWAGMVGAGFAQIPLTLTNATLATSAMIRELFPEKPVSEDRLMLNQGLANIASSLTGGMPMCHGAGGLASQYYFGARTGGANILEGLIEISLGVLLGGSLATLLAAFPLPLMAGMLFAVGVQLGQRAAELKRWPLAAAGITAGVSVLTNMAVGYLAGLLACLLRDRLQQARRRSR